MESCYNHTVNHQGDVFVQDCVPSSCRYFLVIKEVINKTTLELGNETNTYECGKIYGSESSFEYCHKFIVKLYDYTLFPLQLLWNSRINPVKHYVVLNPD